MSKLVEHRSILGLLVVGAMLIFLGAGVVVAENHESDILTDPLTIAGESVAHHLRSGDPYDDSA